MAPRAPWRLSPARILMVVNWSARAAGQASTSRPTISGKSRASRTAAAHPNEPPTTVSSRSSPVAPAMCLASACQSVARRSRSGAMTSRPRSESPSMIPVRRQKKSAPMSSQRPP